MNEKILELKPCAFCGKPPSILKNMGTIYCPNNECFGPQTTAERLEDSAVQWNTRASSPAQEPVTAEPVAWRWKVHGIWHYAGGFPVSGAEPLYAIPAPPQPGREEIAEHLYTKFCADPSIEWQDASEKLKDVWRRYAGEIAALTGEEGK